MDAIYNTLGGHSCLLGAFNLDMPHNGLFMGILLPRLAVCHFIDLVSAQYAVSKDSNILKVHAVHLHAFDHDNLPMVLHDQYLLVASVGRVAPKSHRNVHLWIL